MRLMTSWKKRGNSLWKRPVTWGYNEKTVKDKPPDTGSPSILILASPVSRTGQNKFLLFKLFNVWYFLIDNQTKAFKFKNKIL